MTRVSGSTPSWAMASAPSSVAMAALEARSGREDALEHRKVAGIGLGWPGPVDHEVGHANFLVPANGLPARFRRRQAGIERQPGQHQLPERRRVSADRTARLVNARDLSGNSSCARRSAEALVRRTTERHPEVAVESGQPDALRPVGGNRERYTRLLDAAGV